ncbi:MAG: alpha/beta hydrolase [Solirubrobacterales bacterium]|nr:alpha/beta hydrolase [Solirubrobacterales bacterium]
MTTFLLIPGAGGSAWYWHPVVLRLRNAGHQAIALDLPGDDPDAGLGAYVDMALATAEAHEDLVVVAQSMGAFTAVPVCTRLAAQRLVLLNAMIPSPGRPPTSGGRRPPGSKPAGSPRGRADTPKTSTYTTTFCMTCRPTSPPTVQSTSARKPTSPSRSRARSQSGQPCRRSS